MPFVMFSEQFHNSSLVDHCSIIGRMTLIQQQQLLLLLLLLLLLHFYLAVMS